MATHPAFEKAIDENPLEATTHLAYADWLDENGDPDEAAFRRSMGNWIEKQRGRIKSTGKSGFSLGRTHPWSAATHDVPDGVPVDQIPLDNSNDPLAPPHYDAWRARKYGWSLNWPTYRGMESGLRQAFMDNRYDQKQRNSRRLANVICKSRKGK